MSTAPARSFRHCRFALWGRPQAGRTAELTNLTGAIIVACMGESSENGPGTPPRPSPPPHWAVGRVTAVGFLSWALDAFDFFLVVLCLTNIARTLHSSDVEIAATITLTLAFRPVGAAIFGYLADRYGRRRPMMLNLVFYSLMEVLSGLAPNYLCFLVLRGLFGIGMGGLWGPDAALTMESAPLRLRGILSGVLQEGYIVGSLLAALAYYLVVPAWGWRCLFYLGGLPALLAVFVRWGVPESPVWQSGQRLNLVQAAGTLAHHWKRVLSMILLMTMMNFSSHGTQDMYPTFLVKFWHVNAMVKSALTAIASCGGIVGGILIGCLSDRYGRRRALASSLILAFLVTPLWAFAPGLGLLALGGFLMQFLVQGAWGVIPAHLTELSPDSVRGILPGFAYQCGVCLASAAAVVESLLARYMPYSVAMASAAGVILVLAAIVARLGPENHQRLFIPARLDT